MPVFRYKAKDSVGKTVTGTLVANNEHAASVRLDEMGYTPIAINPEKKAAAGSQKKPSFFSMTEVVKPYHLIAFTRQFATIVKAGVPIVQGLSILSEQSESKALKDVLRKVVHDIEGGLSLSQALEKHPQAFPDLYVSTVVAGESGGVLDKVLLRLAGMLERDHETQSNVKTALRYPLMVVISLFVASLVLVTFVVPKFEGMYARFGGDLPLPTQILLLANTIIRGYWFIAVPAFIVFIWLFHRYINTKSGRYQWDSVLLKLPIFGDLLMKVAMSRFALMLSTLNESGLPILRSLEIVSITVGNAVIGREVDKLRTSVADGRSISDSIIGGGVFPPMVAHMISIGEKSGSLSDMLNSVADYYDLEVNNMIKNLTVLIEPLMTAVLASVVLGLALAIFLPLWNMIALFQQ